MHLFLLFVLTLIEAAMHATAISGSAYCTSSSYIGGHWSSTTNSCFKFYNERLKWGDAYWRCFNAAPSGWKGRLAFVPSQTVFQILGHIIKNSRGAWFGLVEKYNRAPTKSFPPRNPFPYKDEWEFREADKGIVDLTWVPETVEVDDVTINDRCMVFLANDLPAPFTGPKYNNGNCLSDKEDGSNIGAACEFIDLNECESSPCKNGGTCDDEAGRFTCRCRAGYTGSRCDTDIDECESSPCRNDGRCEDLLNKYRCSCKSGFSGSRCQTDVNECISNPCLNGARCTDGSNRYSCECPPGFSGTRCQTDINECISGPCRNGGTCVDGVNRYSCRCKSGFTGRTCLTNINECQSIPCRNGGKCLDGLNEYSCQCTTGFTGQNCETARRTSAELIVTTARVPASSKESKTAAISTDNMFTDEITTSSSDAGTTVIITSAVGTGSSVVAEEFSTRKTAELMATDTSIKVAASSESTSSTAAVSAKRTASSFQSSQKFSPTESSNSAVVAASSTGQGLSTEFQTSSPTARKLMTTVKATPTRITDEFKIEDTPALKQTPTTMTTSLQTLQRIIITDYSKSTKVAASGTTKKWSTPLQTLSPTDCWGHWAQWSDCTRACGGGRKRRTRLKPSGVSCYGDDFEKKSCDNKRCEVCQWNQWSEWGLCSVTCGEGTRIRFKTKWSEGVNKTGADCQGPKMEIGACNGSCAGGADVTNDPISLSASLIDSSAYASARLTESKKLEIGHELEETVPLCFYDGKACHRSDWKIFYDGTFGNCFTFNFMNPPKYHSYKAGAQQGLVLVVQGSQDDYICTSLSAGFKLQVHNYTEHPFPDSSGVNIAPGVTAAIGIKRTVIKRLSYPYGDCVENNDEGSLYGNYDGSYTVEGCLRSCFQKNIVDQCGCGDPRMPLPGKHSEYCNIDKKGCIDHSRECEQHDVTNLCKQCKQLCKETVFSYVITTSRMERNDFLRHACRLHNSWNETGYSECIYTYKKNFAIIRIYYETMNSMVFVESPAYTIVDLCSEFAGLMGMVLGTSIITFVEFAFAVVDLVMFISSGGRKSIVK